MKGLRSRQLTKAYNMMEKAGEFISVIIPAHVDLQTGDWVLPQYVDVYKDEIDIYRQIYGNRLIEIVE
jgi:hypothetical protein